MSDMEKVEEPTVISDPEALHIENLDDQLAHLIPDKKEYDRVVRKIDWRIVPIMFLCYALSFLDKVVLNYAAVMGLLKDLHLKGNEYSNLATFFFVAYVLAEFPQGLLFQKYPVSMVLGINTLLWGIIVACTSATHNYSQLLALRLLLGIFEASIAPALTLTTSMWYTKRQSAPRYGIWYCGLGVAQILGGLISFGAQHGPMKNFSGWRIMMVVVGIVNILVALTVLFFLPTSIESAKFLTTNEKELVRRMLIIDQAGNGDQIFKVKGILEIIWDPQIWLLTLLAILLNMSSGVITTYSATLIEGFGFNSKQSALLNMPGGAVSILSIIFATYAIGRGYQRWLALVITVVPAILGAGLMSFAPIHNEAAKLAGIYLYSFLAAAMAITFSWVGANTAGYSKKVAANAAIAIGIGIGSIISPQTFQAKDAPEYLPAKITVLVAAAATVVTAVALSLLYLYRNKKTRPHREAEIVAANNQQRLDPIENEEGFTDRTNPAFIYVY